MVGLVNGAKRDLPGLIAGQRDGHTLDQDFYGDEAIYAQECDRIFLKHWHYVCHGSQIAEPGQYRLFRIAGEEVILVRQKDGAVKALINVCRHRGSRVCWEAQGKARSFVCPYHGWAYGLDGQLLAARMMPEDFDKETRGLHEIAVGILEGLVFINFQGAPEDFADLQGALQPSLAPFDLANCKVAASRVWEIEANWKLALENYHECYHCSPAHPDFAKSHSIKRPHEEIAHLYEALQPRSAACGVPFDLVASNPHPDRPGYHYGRYPLTEGYQTGSEDGAPLAPLLGRLSGFDGGASDLAVDQFFFALIYADHAVLYRFTPRSARSCDCEVVWLVRADAEEGKDYDLARLTWLWSVTTDADETIIQKNQQGVDSRYYRPGPYAPMEHYALKFRNWYLAALGG